MIATGLRLGLSLLVLTYVIGNLGTIGNRYWILGAGLFYIAIALFTLVLSIREGKATSLVARYSTPFDIVYFSILSGISGGYQSPFNFLIFFIIIDAATGHRFLKGVRLMALAVALYGLVSLFTLGPQHSVLQLGMTLGVLMALGFGIAYRSGHEKELKQRLRLTQQVSAVASPRLGFERAIGISLALLRDYFSVKECLFLLKDFHTDELVIYSPSDQPSVGKNPRETVTDGRFLAKTMSIPDDVSVIFYGRKSAFRWTPAIGVSTDDRIMAIEPLLETLEDVAESLDARQFLSVPVIVDRNYSGRIFVLHSGKGARFQSSDLKLVTQVAQSLIPLIENGKLIDTLSSSIAEEERKRIARDIHDSIIQPYLGLKLGLESLSSFIEDGHIDGAERRTIVGDRLKSMRELAETTIEHLRDLVAGLADSKTTGTTLLPSLKRFADKFASVTSINVRILTEGDMTKADRLAPDLFQLAVEGLSNIRKHTDSPTALIELIVSNDEAKLRITNEGKLSDDFHPKSIAERIASLGGSLQIVNLNGKCILELTVPLDVADVTNRKEQMYG
jgi:signal transduction histidine kinase